MDGEINDGGPAFPVDACYEGGVGRQMPRNEGMSLLDWFAGKALANPAIADSNLDENETALLCYSQAQAMIKVRERINASAR